MNRKQPYQRPEVRWLALATLDVISASDDIFPDDPLPPDVDPSVPDIEW